MIPVPNDWAGLKAAQPSKKLAVKELCGREIRKEGRGGGFRGVVWYLVLETDSGGARRAVLKP